MRMPMRQVRTECPSGCPSVRSSAYDSAEMTSERRTVSPGASLEGRSRSRDMDDDGMLDRGMKGESSIVLRTDSRERHPPPLARARTSPKTTGGVWGCRGIGAGRTALSWRPREGPSPDPSPRKLRAERGEFDPASNAFGARLTFRHHPSP